MGLPESCDSDRPSSRWLNRKGSDSEPAASSRPEAVRLALLLEYLTVGWNLIEGVIAVTAGILAGSVALLGFGIDSFVESASGSVMIWRLRAERSQRLSQAQLGAAEHRARRFVAVTLFMLAAWITFDAAQTLLQGDHPAFSGVGVGLTTLSLAIMLWLARAKQRVAQRLGSRAMQADAFQTTACWWLSLATLVGVGLNGLFGWWWADPLAALVIAALIVREGREAWNDERCC
jgi:cation diffusion facilitator family transporter